MGGGIIIKFTYLHVINSMNRPVLAVLIAVFFISPYTRRVYDSLINYLIIVHVLL